MAKRKNYEKRRGPTARQKAAYWIGVGLSARRDPNLRSELLQSAPLKKIFKLDMMLIIIEMSAVPSKSNEGKFVRRVTKTPPITRIGGVRSLRIKAKRSSPSPRSFPALPL